MINNGGPPHHTSTYQTIKVTLILLLYAIEYNMGNSYFNLITIDNNKKS